MLNSIIQCFQRRVERNSCLTGEAAITVFIFTISTFSCFLVLFLFVGLLWASIFLCLSAFLSSLYIHWLRRSMRMSHMIPFSLPLATVQEDVGLDASAIAVLPSFQYQRYWNDSGNGVDGNGWVQCAICIGTVQIGEMVRNLPACKHLFHVECIDLWLSSHSTCPMCRTIVVPSNEEQSSV